MRADRRRRETYRSPSDDPSMMCATIGDLQDELLVLIIQEYCAMYADVGVMLRLRAVGKAWCSAFASSFLSGPALDKKAFKLSVVPVHRTRSTVSDGTDDLDLFDLIWARMLGRACRSLKLYSCWRELGTGALDLHLTHACLAHFVNLRELVCPTEFEPASPRLHARAIRSSSRV